MFYSLSMVFTHANSLDKASFCVWRKETLVAIFDTKEISNGGWNQITVYCSLGRGRRIFSKLYYEETCLLAGDDVSCCLFLSIRYLWCFKLTLLLVIWLTLCCNYNTRVSNNRFDIPFMATRLSSSVNRKSFRRRCGCNLCPKQKCIDHHCFHLWLFSTPRNDPACPRCNPWKILWSTFLTAPCPVFPPLINSDTNFRCAAQ